MAQEKNMNAIKFKDEIILCNNCKEFFKSTQTRRNHKPKFCSPVCFGLSIQGVPFFEEHCKKISISKKNEKHPRWKGNKASYSAIHRWMRDNFGSASNCSNIVCPIKKPKVFDWALIHGNKHSHKRSSYISLCRSCHRRYDCGSLILNKC